MSANNQVLIHEYNGKWYVWNNIMAESWDDKNEVSIEDSRKSFDTHDEALLFALKLDDEVDEIGMPNSEYGVGELLAKDGRMVTVTE